MDFLHTDKQKPEILDIRIAARTTVFEIQQLDLRFANGVERVYERLTPARRPAVMILPIYDNHLLMIREYSAGTERYELTLPKGLIDKGETPEQSANRELQEEIGFAANQLFPLRMLYTSPGHMYSPMHVFVAEQLYPSKLEGDEPEPLETVAIPLYQIDDLIALPEFGDARILTSLFFFKDWYSAKYSKIGKISD